MINDRFFHEDIVIKAWFASMRFRIRRQVFVFTNDPFNGRSSVRVKRAVLTCFDSARHGKVACA
eukprot:16339029-Heterocapsa_arctica.AAC.1